MSRARRLAAPINPLFHSALRAYLGRVRPAFVLGGRRYSYFWHDYNMTWRNERCVEVPLARALLGELAESAGERGQRGPRGHRREPRAPGGPGARVLEVGNVLSHYFPVSHDVVDKYERAPGIRNEDIVDFVPERRYDLIVSLSTLEHVGWDETPREPEKALRAVAHLKARCLAPGGRMLVTFPVGHHPELDRAFAEDRLPFTQSHCMKREGRFAHWREATWTEIRDAAYGQPYPFANALIIGIAGG